MCLAVPMKLISRSQDAGTCEMDGVRVNVILTLTPEVVIGDYVIVHAGYALAIMAQEEALETQSLFQAMKESQP
jgi:hydrogenase expression/formation protein HypC